MRLIFNHKSVCGGIITFDFDEDFKFAEAEKFVQESVRNDVSGNAVYINIARIPPSEENYFPLSREQKNDQFWALYFNQNISLIFDSHRRIIILMMPMQLDSLFFILIRFDSPDK